MRLIPKLLIKNKLKIKFPANTQYAETQLSDIYNVIRYKSKKLQLEKESFNVRKNFEYDRSQCAYKSLLH